MSDYIVQVAPAELERLEGALQTASDTLASTVNSILDEMAGHLTQWSQMTSSRQAQLEREADIRTGVGNLAQALVTVKDAVRVVIRDAHEAEVRAVVTVD